MPKQINIDGLAEELLRRAAAFRGSGRLILGVAGPPGVGKSTFCEHLQNRLNEERDGVSAIFPMDGFHFDDVLLDQKGWRARKGAPHTFDVGGFEHTLRRLKSNEEEFVAVPVFDRAIEIARAGSRMILQNVQIILVEGNYLLLNEPPWDRVVQYIDMSVMLKADGNEIQRRLGVRWVDNGLNDAEVLEKLEINDLPNARNVIHNSAAPDYEVWTDRA